MISLTDTQKANLVSANPKTLTMSFDGGAVLTNENILSEQMSITQTICDGQSFELGSLYSTEFKTRIFNDDETSYVGQWFYLSISVDNTSTSIRLGRFKVASETLTDDKLYKDIVAYDALHDVLTSNYADWHNSFSFPTTVRNYRNAFFGHIGIAQISATLPNDDQYIEQTFVAESYSGADCLRYLCEITGCFGVINSYGYFRWITVNTTSSTTIADDYIVQGGLKYEEFTTNPVACVHIREVENDIGGSAGDIDDGNTYYITGNLFASGKSTTELVTLATNILGNIQNISYTPASVNTVGMPWLECGDVISIVTPRKTVTFPIFGRTLTGISALRDSYQAGGSKVFTQNVNAQSLVVNQLKRRSAVLKESIEEVSTRMTEITSDISQNYYTKSETESYVGQTADSITQSVGTTITNSENALKEYTDAQVSLTADGLRSDIAYAINGTDYLSSYRAISGWDKRSASYVTVSLLSNGYYEIQNSHTNAGYIYGVHKVIVCPAASRSYIFKCDVQEEAYIKLVVNSSSSASWVNASSNYTHVTPTKTYQTTVTTTSTNKYIHIYIGTIPSVTAKVKNPRLIYTTGSSDMATAMSSYITQTAERIQSNVTATNDLRDDVSAVTQTANSVRTTVTNITKKGGSLDQIKSSINQTAKTIALSITGNSDSTQNPYLVLTYGGNKKSTVDIGGFARFKDLSSNNEETKIAGGKITSSSIHLQVGSGGAVPNGGIYLLNKSGTQVGSINGYGLKFKDPSRQWYVSLKDNGKLSAGKGNTQYGYIDCSTNAENKCDGKVRRGLTIGSQVIRLKPDFGLSINGMWGVNKKVQVCTAVTYSNGKLHKEYNFFKFRGGICTAVGSQNTSSISISSD